MACPSHGLARNGLLSSRLVLLYCVTPLSYLMTELVMGGIELPTWPSLEGCGNHVPIHVSTQGVSLTAQRAAIVVGVELPVYDITKKHLILSGLMGDTVSTHFLYVYGF